MTEKTDIKKIGIEKTGIDETSTDKTRIDKTRIDKTRIDKTRTDKTGFNLENSYANLPNSFFTSMEPTPVRSPKLIILNHALATSLGLNIKALQSKDGVDVLAGNQVPKGARPLAQAYAGHQFGHFTMLGDGRALLLGEQITPKGERVDIQLKGSGRTPYSRRGDGRAGLGPMLREYIISEAMHALGIATTRSLAVVTTGEKVIRENEQIGAILTRVADSHLRVGTFEYVAKWCSLEELRALTDYTMQRHFPDAISKENPYLSLLEEVIKRQATLIAQWQLVGFVHGVMNTDNMVLSGEGIDYGPCAFMDTYDRATVFSSIDSHGRYAYGNQPNIAAWDLARFAETILPLIDENQEKAIELAQEAIIEFTKLYQRNWIAGMRAKLGIFNEEPEDEVLFEELLNIMQKSHSDYTNTFIALTFDKLEEMDLFASKEFMQWNKLWQARRTRQQESKASSHNLMRQSNPALIPRNHRVEEALEAAVKDSDFSVMERLLEALSDPFAHSIKQADYSMLPKVTTCYQTFCGT